MYTLFKNVGLRKAVLSEAPSLTLSMAIAEIFFKWGSFTRECLGFLVTWFVLSYLLSLVFNALSPKEDGAKRQLEA